MWTIYSLGDVNFLAAALRALAMFFGSGAAGALAGIGLLAGALYQGFRVSAEGAGPGFGRVFAAGIFYLCFFAPKADVAVEDCRGSAVVKVDGVPLGPAAAGAIVSALGRGLSDYAEQAFAVPGRDGGDFALAATALAGLRRRAAEIGALAAVNGDGGGDFARSWLNYFRECTLTGVDLREISPEALFGAADVVRAGAFASDAYGTLINLTGKDERLTCREAHARLAAHTNGAYADLLGRALDGGEPAGAPAGDTYRARVNRALSMLGIVNGRLENYMIAAVLLPVYLRAAEKKHVGEHEAASALLLAGRVAGRNSSAALGQAMFFSCVRPLMTFFEALLFMLSAFAPLALAGCDAGVRLCGRYASFMLWVELWHPLMTMVNLYLAASASGELAAAAAPPESFSGLLRTEKILESHIALGGYLSAAVPALALAVLTGGSAALGAIAARAAGGDAGAEGHLPELEKRGPVVAHAPLFSGSPAAGLSLTGSAAMMPAVSLRDDFRRALSSAESEALGAERSFGRILRESGGRSFSASVTRSDLENVAARTASSDSESAAMVSGLARGVMSGISSGETDETAVRGALSLALSGRLPAGGPAGLASAAAGSSSTRAATELASELERISQDGALRAEYSRSLARDISSGRVSAAAWADTRSAGEELAASARAAAGRRSEVSRLRAAAASAGSGYELDGATAGRIVAGNPELLGELRRAAGADPRLARRANELRNVMDGIFPDARQAEAAAALRALTERDPLRAAEFTARAFAVRREALARPEESLPGAAGPGAPGALPGGGIPAPETGAPAFPEPPPKEEDPLYRDYLGRIPRADAPAGFESRRLAGAPVRTEIAAGGAAEPDGAYAFGLSAGLTPAQAEAYAAYASEAEPGAETMERLRKEAGPAFAAVNERLSAGGAAALGEVAEFNRRTGK